MITLVVGAYVPELSGLGGVQGALTRAIGVGAVEAAAGAERVLAEVRPSRVVLVGTAGALPRSGLDGELALHQVVVVRAARLILRDSEYAPAPMPLEASGSAALADEIARTLFVPVVDAACPLGVTRSDEEAARVSEACPEAAVEQLECFSLFRAAAQANVPAAAVLAVANRVGTHAHAEWRAHRAKAEAAAQEAIRNWLSAS
jgi:nucleoside phosphorylase